MKLVNLTNQIIRLYDVTGSRVLLELPTDPRVVTDAKVRAETASEFLDDDTALSISVVRHRYTLIDELPESIPGVTYVVGWAVIQAVEELGSFRDDLIAPDTSRESAVRENGRIVGVRQFRVL